MIADFSKHSLLLAKDGKVLFSSDKPGLRPLFECVSRFRSERGCTLYDKVVGLAAAKLVSYSGCISKVVTPLASEASAQHLASGNIRLLAQQTVPRILNKERAAQCPMERKAEQLDDAGFYRHLAALFR